MWMLLEHPSSMSLQVTKRLPNATRLTSRTFPGTRILLRLRLIFADQKWGCLALNLTPGARLFSAPPPRMRVKRAQSISFYRR